MLVRLQKYKKFESNSQLPDMDVKSMLSCFDCKSTKNLRAIHNSHRHLTTSAFVVSTAKVQKIWEQFTTENYDYQYKRELFRLQKYKKFESNSQLGNYSQYPFCVVSTAKVQKIWEQFTTIGNFMLCSKGLFRLQKYKKFESNSQRYASYPMFWDCCFDCKSTKNLRAIHNTLMADYLLSMVVSTAKVQKIWEQFTTLVANLLSFSHERQDVQRCTFGCRSIEVTIPDWWCDRW